MTLYVETNFLMAAAKGQEPRIDELWESVVAGLRLAIPSVCVMEACSVFDVERKMSRRFTEELERRLIQVRRDMVSLHAANLVTALHQAGIEHRHLLNDVQERFVGVLERLSGMRPGCPASEFIEIRPGSLGELLGAAPEMMVNPTDALILQAVLDHAGQNDDPVKALMTANTKDFDTTEARRSLRLAGIEYFFPNVEAALGWLQGHPDAAA